MKIIYCASAIMSHTNMFQIIQKDKKNEYIKYFSESFNMLNEIHDDFKVSVLYNSFTESKYVEYLSSLKENGLGCDIYADSGGLQINLIKTAVSKNIEADKINSYTNQCVISDYAMNFDEMPMIVEYSDNKKGDTARTDASGRYYVRDMVYNAGYKSGVDINEQIRVIKENTANTKVMIILQGYTMDDYNEYARGVYDVLEKENYSYVGGIALANTLSTNYFDAFDVFVRHQFHLNVPEEHKTHIHLLGVGTINRLYPFIVLKNGNFFDKDFTVNFDSTSATSMSTFGNGTIKSKGRYKKINTGYERSKISDIYCNYIYDLCNDNINNLLSIKNNNFEDFIDNYTIYNKHKKRLNSDFTDDENEAKLAVLSHNFNIAIHEIDLFIQQMIHVERGEYSILGDYRYVKTAKMLSKIKNIDEYMEKRGDFKYYLNGVRKKTIPIFETTEQYNRFNKSKKTFKKLF